MSIGFIFSMLFTVLHTAISTLGFVIMSFVSSILYTIVIISSFTDSNLIALYNMLVLFFWLMSFSTFWMRPKYETWQNSNTMILFKGLLSILRVK